MSSEIVANQAVLASYHGPINWMMNQVNDLAHQERYNECQLICSLASPLFAFLSINYHTLAIGLKMPVVVVNYTFLLVPIKVEGQWMHAGEYILPTGFELTEIFKHLAKIAILVFEMILSPLFGLCSPATVIGMHVALGLVELKERPLVASQNRAHSDYESCAESSSLAGQELAEQQALVLDVQGDVGCQESADVPVLISESFSENSQVLLRHVDARPLSLFQDGSFSDLPVNADTAETCAAHTSLLAHAMRIHRQNFEDHEDEWDVAPGISDVQSDRPQATFLCNSFSTASVSHSMLHTQLQSTTYRHAVSNLDNSQAHVLLQSPPEILPSSLFSEIHNFQKAKLKRVETKEMPALAKVESPIQLDAEREAFMERARSSLVGGHDSMPSAFDEEN